eukprot:m.277376 g.277376  ORF g.277376 m.277376 type:complete len:96 (+) comp19781_c0_seq27:240-527(+)
MRRSARFLFSQFFARIVSKFYLSRLAFFVTLAGPQSVMFASFFGGDGTAEQEGTQEQKSVDVVQEASKMFGCTSAMHWCNLFLNVLEMKVVREIK